MKVRSLTAAVALAGALAISATAANATTVFDFGVGPNGVSTSSWGGNQGVSHTYMASGLSVTATAYGSGSGNQLYGKHSGGDENGLGMTNDPSGEHEIYYGKGFIQLDVSSLLGDALSLAFGSTTDGEEWAVYGSNTADTIGSEIGHGTTEGSLNLTGGYKYYDVKSIQPANQYGNGGNVLIKSLSVSAVPEPADWALMIGGVFAIGATLRQQRRRLIEA